MRILITGATGFLGPYLVEAFSTIGDVTGISSKDCDLTNGEVTHGFVGKLQPDMIIHAAALTDVDSCALHPHMAVAYNAGMTENLVQSMPEGCRFIYISTDMVYSGIGPHRENSKSENPINMYGMSKYMGEFVATKAKNHLIVRTNMYGIAKSERKSSLVDFLIGRFKEGLSFNVFTDSMFSPLWTKTLADCLVIMAKTPCCGTYNLGATTSMSKAKFALLVADGMGLSAQGARPIESASILNRAPRPLDTRMEVAWNNKWFDLHLPSMEQDIHAMCESVKCTD